jgi:hypothetical protein
VPPAASSCCEYVVPTVAAGSGDVVVIVRVVTSGFTGSTNVMLAWVFEESVTVAVKLTDPADGGVPVNRPEVLNVSQGGNPVAVHV